MSDYANEVADLVKAKIQQRHGNGKYAMAGHPAETRLLASGKRAIPLHRAVEQQDDEPAEKDLTAEISALIKHYHPDQPRDPHTGEWVGAGGEELKVGDYVHQANHIGEESGVFGTVTRRFNHRQTGQQMVSIKGPDGGTKSHPASEIEHMSSAEQAEHERNTGTKLED